MVATAEVRWFCQGDIPPEVEAWFTHGTGPVEQQPPRVDIYLLIPQTDELNVKLREGKIEIKQRYGTVRDREFAGGNSGTIEFWRKWSFNLDKKSVDDGLDAAATWLAVRKDRTARSYGLQPNGVVIPLPGSSSVDHGCSLELTQVEAGGERWWSLGFEAVGPATVLVETLVDVANRVLSTSGHFRLTTATSCGYSAWLQRFAKPLPPT